MGLTLNHKHPVYTVCLCKTVSLRPAVPVPVVKVRAGKISRAVIVWLSTHNSSILPLELIPAFPLFRPYSQLKPSRQPCLSGLSCPVHLGYSLPPGRQHHIARSRRPSSLERNPPVTLLSNQRARFSRTRSLSPTTPPTRLTRCVSWSLGLRVTMGCVWF